MNELSDLALSVPRRVPLADTVADSIAGAIATGLFVPGEKISEAVLSEQLGVSRVPIGEAFKILHSQGIFTGEQDRGYRVAPFDRATVRKALESMLLRDAVLSWRANHRMDADFSGPLRHMREAAAREDRVASLESDLQFYTSVYMLHAWWARIVPDALLRRGRRKWDRPMHDITPLRDRGCRTGVIRATDAAGSLAGRCCPGRGDGFARAEQIRCFNEPERLER